jgi:hypothetical protein
MDIEKLIEQMKWWAEECDRTNFGCQAKKTLRDAATALSTLQSENEKLRAELEQVKREFDGLCEYIDSEGFLRKQFCENGNPDLEPCICPSLQEHPRYIDSDDCEGCDHFCNSWHGTKEG